jgi:hypothetical protein
MSKTLLSAAAFAVLSFAAFDAQALPLAPAPAGVSAPDVILVEGGCGPGFHRNEFGRCRPNERVIVVPEAPVVVAPAPPVVVVEPRACPLGFHWAPRFGRCIR